MYNYMICWFIVALDGDEAVREGIARVEKLLAQNTISGDDARQEERDNPHQHEQSTTSSQVGCYVTN